MLPSAFHNGEVANRNAATISIIDVVLSFSDGLLKTWYVVRRKGILRALRKEIFAECQYSESRLGTNIEQHGLLKKCRVLSNYVTLLQLFKSVLLPHSIVDCQLGDPVDDEHYLAADLTSLDDLRSLLE